MESQNTKKRTSLSQEQLKLPVRLVCDVEFYAYGAAPIPKISTISDFRFETNGIRIWQFAKIGTGIYVPTNNWDPELYSFHVEHSYVPDSMALFTTISNDHSSTTKEVNDDENIPLKAARSSQLYECPVCGSRFVSEGRFKNHMDFDIHKSKHEKETLLDVVASAYVGSLDETYSFSDALRTEITNEMNENLGQSSSSSLSTDIYAKGWGIKRRKRNTRFTEKQKKFMTELFNKGIGKTGNKIDGKKASSLMKTAKTNDGLPMFEGAEYLNAQQITAFFSRLAASLSNNPVKRNDDDDLTNHNFAPNEDLIMNAVQEGLGEIFE